jgi:hypothetical protein
MRIHRFEEINLTSSSIFSVFFMGTVLKMEYPCGAGRVAGWGF